MYNIETAQSSLKGPYTCVVMTVSAEPLLLNVTYLDVFWFSQDMFGRRMGVFPLANDSAQVKLGVGRTQLLDVIQTVEKCVCGCSGEQKDI